MKSNFASIKWVLLAAGSSSRFGGPQSKLLEKISGRRVIDLTLESLSSALPSAEIILVSSEQLRDACEFRGTWARGGVRRQDSAREGCRAADGADAVLIHDAARPFVSPDLVMRLVESLEDNSAVAPGIPVTDTIKRAVHGRVTETLDRQGLYRLQTPQAVRYSVAMHAFDSMEDGVEYTDDLAVVEAVGERTFLVDGEIDNIKITTREDLVAAREIFARRQLAAVSA